MNNQAESGLSKFFINIYAWMFIGLALSGGAAYITYTSLSMTRFVYSNYTIFLIAEILLVILFSVLRKKSSVFLTKIMFIVYSIVSGLTLSSIFMIFKLDSIIYVFISTTLMFGLLALYGYTTKNDLTSFGKMLMFALIAIIISSIINIFANNGTLGILLSVISVLVFLGLTAWDMQKLKKMYCYYNNDEKETSKLAIHGALELYLDFVNIFLNLLRLFGRGRD